jgi:hypothetical protein
MKLSASQRRRNKRQDINHKIRRKALNQPITLEQVCEFSSRLVRVDYGTGAGCWVYTGLSVGGGSKTYARKKHNGAWTMAHRFSLAVKLGCTVWDLEGYDAAHSSKAICLGGRCCNPDHLFPKVSEPNRSWDRGKDAKVYGDKVTIRTPEEKKAMMKAMHPTGVINDGRLFDEPWQSNASPLLVQFLEAGMRQELENMHQSSEITGQHAQ